MLPRLAYAFFLLMLASPALAQPSVGPWIISDHEVISENHHHIGDIIIQSNGILEIRQANLSMSPTGGPALTASRITIESGGELLLNGTPQVPAVILDDTVPDNVSSLAFGRTDTGLLLLVEEGGTLTGKHCEMLGIQQGIPDAYLVVLDSLRSPSIDAYGEVILDHCKATGLDPRMETHESATLRVSNSNFTPGFLRLNARDGQITDSMFQNGSIIGISVFGPGTKLINITSIENDLSFNHGLAEPGGPVFINNLTISGQCLRFVTGVTYAENITAEQCGDLISIWKNAEVYIKNFYGRHGYQTNEAALSIDGKLTLQDSLIEDTKGGYSAWLYDDAYVIAKNVTFRQGVHLDEGAYFREEGKLTVTIQDTQGTPIPGHPVEIKRSTEKQTTTTNQAGKAVFFHPFNWQGQGAPQDPPYTKWNIIVADQEIPMEFQAEEQLITITLNGTWDPVNQELKPQREAPTGIMPLLVGLVILTFMRRRTE